MNFLSSIKKIVTLWEKISRRLSRYAKNYTLRVIYFVVLFVISLAGSKIELEKSSGASQWKNTEMIGSTSIVKHSRSNWVWDFIHRALQTKNFWHIPLVPFFILIKLLEDPTGTPSPEASLIYTLY